MSILTFGDRLKEPVSLYISWVWVVPREKDVQRGAFLWQVGRDILGNPPGALLKVSIPGTK